MAASSLTHINKKSGKPVVNNYLLKEIQRAEKKLSDKGVAITAVG